MKTRKPATTITKNDIVFWKAFPNTRGLVIEVDDQRILVDIPRVGKGWVKAEKLAVLEEEMGQ